MRKVAVAFRNFAKVPKNRLTSSLESKSRWIQKEYETYTVCSVLGYTSGENPAADGINS
jgi:hypothetical protein